MAMSALKHISDLAYTILPNSSRFFRPVGGEMGMGFDLMQKYLAYL